MSRFLVNGNSVDVPPDFAVRMVRNNSMFLDEVLEGDYSYTINLPGTDKNKVTFRYFELPESLETKPVYICEYEEHGVVLIRGTLEVKKADDGHYECYILSGLARLSEIKEKLIGELEYGGSRLIRGIYQEFNATLTAPDGGGNIQFSYKNGLVANITIPWNTNANLTLLDLKTAIDALTPTQYSGRIVTVTITGSAINIVGEWGGGYPLLVTHPISGSWTAGLISVGPEVSRLSLLDHMTVVMASPDDSEYLFVPIYNLETGMWDHSPISGPALMTEVWVNFYHSGTFVLDYLYDTTGIFATVRVPVCPFPRVFYILREIIKTGDYHPSGMALNDAELNNLLIYTTHCLHRADLASIYDNNLYQLEFKIGDLLPKITVKEFIQRLRKLMGIHFFFNDNRRECYIELFDSLIAATEFVDWTDKVASKPIVSPSEPQGYLFAFTIDSTDGFMEEKVQSIENLTRLADVGQFSDLASLSPKPNDIVRTQKEKIYYRADFNYYGPFIAWKFHSIDFHSLKISDGSIDMNVGCDSLSMYRGVYSIGAGESWLLPQAKQLLNPVTPFDWDAKFNEFGLRLFFYRGMQKNSVGEYYPLASWNDLDYDNSEIADTQYVLTWEGEKGLYNKFWKKYVQWRPNAKQIDMLIDLTAHDWINLDFRKKRQINGVNYFIKSVDMSFPIKGPARIVFYKA